MLSTIETLSLRDAEAMTVADLIAVQADVPAPLKAAIYGFVTALDPAYGSFNPAFLPPNCPPSVKRAAEAEWRPWKIGWSIGVLLPWFLFVISTYLGARGVGLV